MQLSKLLDKESVKSISSRTMISEDNLTKILAEDYTGLTKAKTLGFLSILEREYGLNVQDVRSNAISYFEIYQDNSLNMALPKVKEEKEGRSVWSLLMILALLGYASWYFFTQFDQKRLHDLLPFSETNITEEEIENNESIWSVHDEPIKKMQKEKQEIKKTNLVKSSIDLELLAPKIVDKVIVNKHQNSVNLSSDTSTVSQNQKRIQETNLQTKKEENSVLFTQAVITPVKRLWFGLINIQTGKRDHFSIRKGYTIDLTQGEYLVATSSAPFSLEIKGEIYRYNNGRAHYFKITKSGLTPLSKNAYVRQGGYAKW